jgi:phosphate transport system protein
MRTHYARELQKLQDQLLVLGSMVSQAIRESVYALKTRNLELAKRLIINDKIVNAKRYEIEEECMTLIATQQPAAGDLRLLATILELALELERMGDYAKGIGRIVTFIGYQPLVKPMPELGQMAEIGLDMLRRALDAFIHQDVEAARAIPREDDEVDALYNQVNRALLALIVKQPEVTDHANYLMWAAHNLERAADRVTNICERVIYTATGEFVEFDAEEPSVSGIH